MLSILYSATETLSALQIAERIVDRFPPEKPNLKNAAIRSIVSTVAAKLIVLAQAGYVTHGHRSIGGHGRTVLTFTITTAGIHFLSRK